VTDPIYNDVVILSWVLKSQVMSVTDVVTSLFLLTTVVMTRLTLSQGMLRHQMSSTS